MTFNGDEFDDSFDNAEAKDGFRDIPTGTYQVYVDRATFEVPSYEQEGYPSLQLTCKINEGKYSGSCVFPKESVNPDFIHHLKSMLVKMGYAAPPKPSQIGAELSGMLNRVLVVFVTKKNDKGFSNCYVNSFVKMLGDGASSANLDEPPPHDDSHDPTRTW